MPTRRSTPSLHSTQPIVARWPDGLAVRILPGDQLSRALYVSGTYEPNTLSVLRTLLSAGDVFFDLGANAGVVTLAASRWVGDTGRVYAFEPSPREFQRLIDNLQLSACANVTAVPAAVTDVSGTATLRVAGDRYGGLNTLGDRFPYEGVETSSVESVETTSIDAFVRRSGVGRVAVAKLDIEGSEAAALRGSTDLLRTHRPALLIEIVARALRANASSVADVERVLAQARYAMFRIDESAALTRIATLSSVDEQNIVALPEERASRFPRT